MISALYITSMAIIKGYVCKFIIYAGQFEKVKAVQTFDLITISPRKFASEFIFVASKLNVHSCHVRRLEAVPFFQIFWVSSFLISAFQMNPNL